MQARQCDIQSTTADGIGKTVKVARQYRKTASDKTKVKLYGRNSIQTEKVSLLTNDRKTYQNNGKLAE
jgi:hypothetical protein